MTKHAAWEFIHKLSDDPDLREKVRPVAETAQDPYTAVAEFAGEHGYVFTGAEWRSAVHEKLHRLRWGEPCDPTTLPRKSTRCGTKK